jgi:hypothetical protein
MNSALTRYIATPETSKHRIFTFLDANVAPDNAIVCIGSDDAFVLGVLSSTLHLTWALAAGGHMGVRHTPRYNKGACFEPFAFPAPAAELRTRVRAVAEEIQHHRTLALSADPQITLMKLYDVVDQLRAAGTLVPEDQRIHRIAACGVLRDLHDELDALVAEAYGWPWPMPKEEILERLVALHDARVVEEKRGLVRWLRPEYQIPRFGQDVAAAAPEMALDVPTRAAAKPAAKLPWPEAVIDQIALLRTILGAEPLTANQVAKRVRGARADLLAQQLKILTIMGELRRDETRRYHVNATLGTAA